MYLRTNSTRFDRSALVDCQIKSPPDKLMSSKIFSLKPYKVIILLLEAENRLLKAYCQNTCPLLKNAVNIHFYEN